MRNPSPLVSVVIPAYNVAAYLGEALTSLTRQHLDDFEALVVDDGSTDDTAAVAERFCSQDRRFRLLRKPNGGLSSARNCGLRAARGRFIALLDGDDRYGLDKLRSHVAALQQLSGAAVVYGASRVIRDDGQPTWYRLSGRPIHPDPACALLCKNFVGHGSNAVFAAALLEQVGDFDEGLRSFEDVDFWLRVAHARVGSFLRLPAVDVDYRVRPTALSFDVGQMERSGEQVFESALGRDSERLCPIYPTARAYFLRYLARLALTAGQIAAARHYIERAWAADARIFGRDPRSLTTLLAVHAAPLARLSLRRMLGPSPEALPFASRQP